MNISFVAGTLYLLFALFYLFVVNPRISALYSEVGAGNPPILPTLIVFLVAVFNLGFGFYLRGRKSKLKYGTLISLFLAIAPLIFYLIVIVSMNSLGSQVTNYLNNPSY